MDVASPIHDPAGHVQGVLGAHLHWSWINKVIDHVVQELEHPFPLRFIIADREGRILLGPPGESVKTVDDFMARNEDSGAFLTARSSAAVNQTSELGWSIVAMVSMPHVMAPIYRVRALMLALAVVLGGAFVLLTWLVSKRVVQPIADFATEANRFDPESTTAFRPVAESRLDELGTLARTMSALVAKLRILVGRNQLFIEHAPVPLAIFDKQMRYLMVSRRWLSDYGLSEREVIGQSHYDVLPEIPEHWRVLHQRGLSVFYKTSDF